MARLFHRRVVGALSMLLGIGQTLDSGILQASAALIAVAAAAVVAPAVAFWTSDRTELHLLAGFSAMAALTLVRIAADVALPTLTLAGFFPVVAALLLRASKIRGR
jgi:hypothetical protein